MTPKNLKPMLNVKMQHTQYWQCVTVFDMSNMELFQIKKFVLLDENCKI